MTYIPVTEICVPPGKDGDRNNETKLLSIRQRSFAFSVYVMHDTVRKGGGDTRRLGWKRISFFDLEVSFVLTSSYSCQVRDYLSTGNVSLRSIVSCSVLFYKIANSGL